MTAAACARATVLLSPSLREGVDLTDDCLRFQIMDAFRPGRKAASATTRCAISLILRYTVTRFSAA